VRVISLAAVTTLCFLLVMLRAGVPTAVTIINPHEEPASCGSCHAKVPTAQDAENGDYFLLAETIDGTCHICHPYDCCRIGALTGHNHPSNVDKWDVEKFTEPKTLPLFEGLITCNTCHYHRKNDVPGQDYKLVRQVEVKLDSVDWTRLCSDCHSDY